MTRCCRAGEHQLLQFAVRHEQRLGGRRLEGDPALGADDGVAEVDAAADAVRGRQGFELLDHFDGRELGIVHADRTTALETNRVPRRRPRLLKASFESTQALSGMLPVDVSVSLPPIVTPHRPRLTE